MYFLFKKNVYFLFYIIFLVIYLFIFFTFSYAETCVGQDINKNQLGGTCYYTSNNPPPNWTTNLSNMCSLPFPGFYCNDSWTCADTPDKDTIIANYGQGCSNGWGYTVECCGTAPAPTIPVGTNQCVQSNGYCLYIGGGPKGCKNGYYDTGSSSLCNDLSGNYTCCLPSGVPTPTPAPIGGSPTPTPGGGGGCPYISAVSFNPNPASYGQNDTASVTTSGYVRVDATEYINGTWTKQFTGVSCSSGVCSQSIPLSVSNPTLGATYTFEMKFNSWNNSCPTNVSSGSITVTYPYAPDGWLDSVSSSQFAGWACDNNNGSLTTPVDFYANAPYGGNGSVYLGRYSNVTGYRQDVANAGFCQGNANHGFSFNPIGNLDLSSISDGNSHAIYAYIIDGSNPQLNGNPKNVTFATISGAVYNDVNHNQGGSGYAGIAVGDGYSSTVTDSNGNYSFTNLNAGSYTITMTLPSNYSYTPNTSSSYNITVGPNATGKNFWITPLDTVNGIIYIDYNHNGTQDNGEPTYTNSSLTVNLSQGGQVVASTSTNNGAYTFNNVLTGSYSVSVVSPTNYTSTNNPSFTLSSGPLTQTENLGITPLYSISGNVYNDVNKNKHFDTPPDIGGNLGVVSIGGNNYTLAANGSWTTGFIFESGSYVINYALPASSSTSEWSMTYPVPPTLSVAVGLPGTSIPCNTNNQNDVTCDANGNITGADFGITNELSHFIGICTDQRFDNGFSDLLPQPPGSTNSCGSYSVNNVSYTLVDSYATMCVPTKSSGIIFSDNQNPNFGLGAASLQGFQAGNTIYPEVFNPAQPGVIKTSYEYLMGVAKSSGIDLTNPTNQLATYCDVTNCTLPANLANNVYFANSDVSLNTYTFLSNKAYVFLVNGNLTINGNIFIPTGADVAFAVSGNIIVSPSVGENAVTSSNTNVEGLYTADNSFIIESSANPLAPCNQDGTAIDKRLNIVGSVVVNAGNTGGTIQNQRDLCISDKVCPAFTISLGDGVNGGGGGAGIGLSYILNTPNFIMKKNYFYQEVNP